MDEVEVSRFKGLGEGKSTRMPVRVDGWRRRSAQRNTMDPRVAVAAQGDAAQRLATLPTMTPLAGMYCVFAPSPDLLRNQPPFRPIRRFGHHIL